MGEGCAGRKPRERGAELPISREARADAQIGLTGEQRGEDLRQLTRVVLAVSVDLHRDVVAVLEREAVAGLHRAADAEVVGQADDIGAGLASAVARGGWRLGECRRSLTSLFSRRRQVLAPGYWREWIANWRS